MERDDAMLLHQLVSDLDSSFHLVVDSYAYELRRYIRTKVDNQQDAEDIGQDLFMRAWLTFRGYSPERRGALHLHSWLFAAARNACLNYRRHQKVQRNALTSLYIDLVREAELAPHELVETVIQGMEHSQEIDYLWSSLRALPSPYRETIQLHYFEDMSCQEIAIRSRLSVGTIKSHLSRGRGLLRELIKGEKVRSEQKMDRRDFFRKALAASMTFLAPPQQLDLRRFTELLSPAAASLSIQEELALVETLTKTCWQLLPHQANIVDRRHLDHVRSYRQRLESWLESSPGSPFDMRLTEAMSELMQIEGGLLYALKHLDEAEKSYRAAIRVAHEAENGLLEAIGLAWYGNFLIDTGHADRASAPLEAASLKAKRGGTTPTMSAWIAASQADAWARQRQKDVYQCEVALARAETFASAMGSGQEPYPVPYDSVWSLGYKGSCYVHIGRLEEAKVALGQGIQLIGTGAHRQADFYKNIAITHSLEKDVEAACSCARLAMQIAIDTKAPMELQDAQDAMQEFLNPWKDSSIVKSLMEEFQVVQQKLALA